jgi:uncharacterized glyoxalase superfamily protein PhnB
MFLELVALIVDDYDEAIRFFVEVLEFELVEDAPALSNAGRPKRWVVVRPPGAVTAILLAHADGERQVGAVGDQFAGRVGLFLRVDDFGACYERMRRAGVEFVGEPREEPYGQVAVFLDVAGNRWDLLGPRPRARLRGGCRCGAVRYEVPDEFLYAWNCHCSRCRAATGSAFKPLAGIEREKLALVRGADALLVVGDDVLNDTRCAACGSFLYSVVRGGAYVHVGMGSLIDVPSIRPSAHIFVGSKAPWFEITDDLPQFEEYAS